LSAVCTFYLFVVFADTVVAVVAVVVVNQQSKLCL